MFCLLLSLIPTIVAIESIQRYKIVIRLLFFLFAIAPTFIFSSSFNMLMTTNIE